MENKRADSTSTFLPRAGPAPAKAFQEASNTFQKHCVWFLTLFVGEMEEDSQEKLLSAKSGPLRP